MPFQIPRYALFLLFLLVMPFPAEAANLNIVYTNTTDFEIFQINAELTTSHGMRNTRSAVCLRKDQDFRTGVSGAIEPMRISLDVPGARWKFADLSGLDMSDWMHLSIVHDNGEIWLHQTKSGEVHRKVKGTVTRYLTVANIPNAVEKDVIITAKTMDDVEKFVAEAVTEAADSGEKSATFDLNAGPIWNQEHALERCPELLKEWKEHHPDAGTVRWTGQWWTTVPGEMSVCNFKRDSAGLRGTLFEEDDGKTRVFPVVWNSKMGVGRALPMGAGSEEVAIAILWTTQAADMAEVLTDLNAQGYRPLFFNLEKREGPSVEKCFPQTGKSAAEAFDRMREACEKARSDDVLRDFTAILVREETYKEVAEGKDITPAPGVLLRCTYQTMDTIYLSVNAAYLPDCPVQKQ